MILKNFNYIAQISHGITRFETLMRLRLIYMTCNLREMEINRLKNNSKTFYYIIYTVHNYMCS